MPTKFAEDTNTNGLSSSQPFSTLLFARMGNGIATNQLMKMVAGAINPGRPVANLYVSIGNLCLLGNTDCSTNVLLVFYVEPRRCRYIHQPCRRPQDGPVFEDPSPCHVLDAGVGYHPWYVNFAADRGKQVLNN